MSTVKLNQASYRMEAMTELDYEEFEFVWKINAFSPKCFANEIIESPIFGGEKVQHSWKLQWKYDNRYYPNYCYKIHIILVKIGDQETPIESVRAQVTVNTKQQPHPCPSTVNSERLQFSDYHPEKETFELFRIPDIQLFDKQKGLIVDNILTVYCRIIVKFDILKHTPIFKTISPASAFRFGFPAALTTQEMGLMSTDIPTFAQEIGTALLSKEFSDVLVVAQSKTFNAHKVILAARSPVFAAMFRTSMIESKNKTVEIVDFEKEVVEEMLQYIYTGETAKLPDKCPELLGIADKYELLGLKATCEQFLMYNLKIENAAETLLLADLYRAKVLHASAVHFIVTNRKKVAETGSFRRLAVSHPEILLELFAI